MITTNSERITTMKMKYILTLILLGSMITAFNGCSYLKKRVEKTEKEEYKLNASNKTRISIDDSNGDIRITRTNDTLGYVIINAEKSYEVRYDEQDKPIENVKIIIDTTGNEIIVKTEIKRDNGMFRSHRGGEVNYNVKIPANMNVSIDNTNGDIILTGLNGDVDIETVNSSISLAHCSGMIKVDGVNGGVYANIDSTRGVNIELVNGTVKLGGLKNISADVNAQTVNGRIRYSNLELTDVVAEKKTLTGKINNGGNMISVSTVNGNVTFDAQQIAYKKENNLRFKLDFDDDGDLDVYELKDGDDNDINITVHDEDEKHDKNEKPKKYSAKTDEKKNSDSKKNDSTRAK